MYHNYWLKHKQHSYAWCDAVLAGSIYIYICYKVFSPISGYSKRWTPLISGQFSFHPMFSSQSLIENFLKGGHLISRHSNKQTIFFTPNDNFGLFLFPITDSSKQI